jgi:hypothetical protein
LLDLCVFYGRTTTADQDGVTDPTVGFGFGNGNDNDNGNESRSICLVIAKFAPSPFVATAGCG